MIKMHKLFVIAFIVITLFTGICVQAVEKRLSTSYSVEKYYLGANDKLEVEVTITKNEDVPSSHEKDHIAEDRISCKSDDGYTFELKIGNTVIKDCEIKKEEENKYIITKMVKDMPKEIADRTYRLELVTYDEEGNSDDCVHNIIVFDRTPPTAPTITCEKEWNNSDTIVKIKAGNADISGLDKVTYTLSGATTLNEETKLEGDYITIQNEGITVVSVYTYDKAGNKSEVATKEIKIEKNEPQITFTDNGGKAETKKDFSIGINVEDLGDYISGVDESSFKYIWTTSKENITEESFIDGKKFGLNAEIHSLKNTAGEYYLSVLAKDKAGNTSIKTSEKFIVDDISPNISFETNGNESDLKIKGTKVNVDDFSKIILRKYLWTADDKFIPSKEDFSLTFTVEDTINYEGPDGEYYLWIYVEDIAENGAYLKSNKFIIDNTSPEPPEITAFNVFNGFIKDKSTVNKIVTIEIKTGKDARVGSIVSLLTKIEKDNEEKTEEIKFENNKYILTDSGTYKITSKSIDDAGNESNDAVFEITIDKEIPNTPEVRFKSEVDNTYFDDNAKTNKNITIEVKPKENENTIIKVYNEEGNDVTADFTNDAGKVVINKSGKYTITVRNENKQQPSKYAEITKHITLDVDCPIILEDTETNKKIDSNTSVSGLIKATDNFGVVKYFIEKNAENGNAEINEETGKYKYSPRENFYGVDKFYVFAKDELGNVSEQVEVVIEIRKVLAEEDILKAEDKQINTTKNNPAILAYMPTQDLNGANLSYTIESEPANGKIGFDVFIGWYIYEPNEDFVGTDSFKIKVSNEIDTIEIVFNVTVEDNSGDIGEIPDENESGDKGDISGDDKDPEDPKDDFIKEEHLPYIQGYKDKTIRPNANMTREELATIIYRLLGEKKATTTKKYSDVNSDRWSYNAIIYLTQIGILEGYKDNSFRPTSPITRAEIAVVITRFETKLSGNKKVTFTDVAEHWAYKAIYDVAKSGIILGYPDSTFKPNNAVTRAETITIMNRLLGRNVESVDSSLNPYKDLNKGFWAFNDIMEATVKHTGVIDKQNSKENWE